MCSKTSSEDCRSQREANDIRLPEATLSSTKDRTSASMRESWMPRLMKTGPGRGNLDEQGVRWPEKVELRGDAREFWEASRMYGKS